MQEFILNSHTMALRLGPEHQGILVEDADAGESCIVAQFYDNFLDGKNRVHQFAALFANSPKMESLLERAITEWPAYDTDEDVSGSDLVDWFGTFRAEAKNILGTITSSAIESSTDQGIQGLQAAQQIDETSEMPPVNKERGISLPSYYPVDIPIDIAFSDRLAGLADEFMENWGEDQKQSGENDPEYQQRVVEYAAIRPLWVNSPALLDLVVRMSRELAAGSSEVGTALASEAKTLLNQTGLDNLF